MDFLRDSLLSAVLLIGSRDPELFQIIGLSLQVSGSSTAIAALLGVPAGLSVAFAEFRAKRLLMTCLNTLLAMPTVVVGLLVYAFISRRGILGAWDLLYTPKAIVIGQVILILPIVVTFTITAVSRIDARYRQTAQTLGAGPLQSALVVLREARFGIVAAVILAFGRVIAEVGISMMLGGNARGYTRTMTTAMALEYDKGEFAMSVALGLVLLAVSFGVNVFFHYFQGKYSG